MTPAHRRTLILALLRTVPDATVRDVARRLNMDALRVAGMLTHLEAYGLVQGDARTRGRRYRLLELPEEVA